ncbi:MAG: DNA polymerase III subunit alpha [Planctomycetota bacterium]|nr:DNA polymerase III subunit alpha [Planctomycetota bacterium]
MPTSRPSRRRANPRFVHLHVHSAYSLLAGASSVEALVARASAQGHAALALTDTDAAYGLPLFQACCDAVELQAIHGAEIHDPRLDGERAVVLAQGEAGYRSLCRLITRRRLDERFSLIDDLPREAAGLLVLTPSPTLLRQWAEDLAPDALYAEVIASAPETAQRHLIETAGAVARPLAGTHRVFFDHRRRHGLHRMLLAIGQLKFLREIAPGGVDRHGRPLDLAPPEAELLPPDAAARAFRDLPEAARATLEIAERCRFRFRKPERPRLPALDPAMLGESQEDGTHEAAYARLAHLCLEGVKRRYGRIRPDVLARLERELRVIQMRGFADYFLIVHGLAEFARGRGIPAVGRGSAANSIVAYALDITSVDPLRFDLPFERFLSPARRDCPDIDLDIDWRGRDTVIEHAYDTYGEERVAMISTHITFRARSAVREAAKTLGLPPPEVGKLVKHLPWHLEGELDFRRLPPELAGIPVHEDPWKGLLRAAHALHGLPRHLSIHVGGIVIGDGRLADSLPLERSAKGLVVTQYDMHGVEDTGLVKIDLLGNRGLAVIADTARDARTFHDHDVDLAGLPEDDARAGALLREGRTFGCFQVESPAMRNLVVRMDAHTQEDAMIALSLVRPGPAGSGMKDAYVRRRRGEEETPALHPTIDPLFETTYGVMLYQEDTLRAAAAVAGFDLAQADLLRRALGKKREPEDLPRMERAFREGAAGRDVPPHVIDEVWAGIRRFSAYAYNKAHAATYSRISWQGLYLKARYPAEFIASVLRNGGGFYAARAYVEEARRLGCRIELPCVNRSDVGPLGRLGVLRLGLDQIKSLRQGTPEALVRIREAQGPYLSPTDLLLRTEVEKHEVERLVLAGALDVFDRPRGELLWLLTLDFERYVRARRERRERSSLFGPTALLPPPRSIPVPPTYRTEELLAMEVEALGLTATCHPQELWAEAAREAGARPTTELHTQVGRRVKVAGWIVTDRRVRVRERTRGERPQRPNGRYMKFLMLEDLHGTVEVTLFPDAYARVGHRLGSAGPFLVSGIVRDDHGSLTLDARDVVRLDALEGS